MNQLSLNQQTQKLLSQSTTKSGEEFGLVGVEDTHMSFGKVQDLDKSKF